MVVRSVVASTVGPLVVAAILGLIYLAMLATAEKEDPQIAKSAASYTCPDELVGAFKAAEEDKFRKMFALMDSDGGGVVDKDELLKVTVLLDPLKGIDDTPGDDIEKAVANMLKEASLDGDAEISFGEFLLVMHRARRQGRTKMFTQLVDKVDARLNKQTGSGVIYALLTLTFLVLISTSTALFHFLKCNS